MKINKKEGKLVGYDNAMKKRDRMFWMYREGTSDKGSSQRIVLKGGDE